MSFSFKALARGAAGVAVAGAMSFATAVSAQTLKVVMHSDLKILDPTWTTAYIVRNHGYLVWDTLFAMDEKFDVKPQMVDKWTVSDDKLTYTFTLRDGLEWHDGKPVTADDVVFSFNILKEKGSPQYALYWQDVVSAEKLNERRVKFAFRNADNNELPSIVGQLPVLPKH